MRSTLLSRIHEAQGRLATLGANAPGLRAYRAGVLDVARDLVPFDAAVFHAFSPRVPLETGVVVGLDPAMVGGSRADWDDFAVELGVVRDLANERLAVTDREAFATGSRGRARFERKFVRRFGMGSLAMVHLIVRGVLHAGIALLARRRGAFGAEDAATLRALAPTIAVGDALHVRLDGAPSASTPIRLACRDERLTPRQREIVEHVAMGQTNEAIGRALGLSPNTTRNHLARVFQRIGAANRADVVRLAVLTPRVR